MTLTLYQSYNRIDIDTLLPITAQPTVVEAITFLVAPKLLICLANTAFPEQIISFNKPTELVWSPRSGTHEAAGMVTGQLPGPLKKVFLSRAYQRFLFVTTDDANYQYVGQIELSSIGVSSSAMRGGIKPSTRRRASFYIIPKLSPEAWARLGGFTGWKLTVNSRVQNLSRGASLEAALSPEWEADVVEVYLTRYEEDYFHLVANGDSAVVTYENPAGGVTMSSRNRTYIGRPRALTQLVGFDLADWEILTRDVVSKGEALELLKAFFQTGEPQGLVAAK